MPYALSTTKRKFHRILDSISNASSPSLMLNDRRNASTANLTSLESPAKKPRLMHPAVFLGSTLNVTNQVTSTTSRPPASLSMMNNEVRKAPNFAPWDRTQFLERLKTFRRVDKWTGKPEKVNEVQWARRGWSCVGKEMVGCLGGCGSEVVLKLEEDSSADQEDSDEASGDKYEGQEWREGAQEELIKKYADIIVTGHEELCLWRRRGCDDTIYRLPLAHQATALSSLRVRYESLLAISSDLPSSVSTPESFNLAPTSTQLFMLLYLSPGNFQADPTKTAPPINNEALTLALFGWQAEPSPIPALATCPACFRRLGLWLFKPASSASSPTISRLDVANEHRDYCPWVNPESQNPTPSSDQNQQPRPSNSDQAGWEILLRMINNNSARAERRSLSDMSEATGAAALDGGFASEVGSILSRTETGDTKARDARDRERWAKLKKLKQVFHVKRNRGKGAVDKEKEKQKSLGKENAPGGLGVGVAG